MGFINILDDYNPAKLIASHFTEVYIKASAWALIPCQIC
jgi:hypothetical protein